MAISKLIVGIALAAHCLCSLGRAVKKVTVTAEQEGYQELYFQQALDHSDSSSPRWSHRYLLGNESWDGRGALPNGCRGPILIYAGNEGPVEAFWQLSGFWTKVLAPKWGGLLVFPEERFYGKSMPCGNASMTPECLKFLTTSQVLEDFATLLAHLKQTIPGAANCPAISFGGSYGGTLSALFRATHPELITGALAASSELGYYDTAGWPAHGVNEFAFEDIVAAAYAHPAPAGGGPQCLQAIVSATSAISRAAGSKDAGEPGLQHLAQQFNVCEPAALGPAGDRTELFTYALEGLPQGNYPHAVDGLPAWPVAAVCQTLMQAEDDASLIQAAAQVTRLAVGIDGSDCIPNLRPGGPGNTPGDGPGPSSWGYQSCTETLHNFSARVIRNYTFNYESSAKLCADVWAPSVIPDMTKLATLFGAYRLAEGPDAVSRIIWSQGTLDPWHGWFNHMTEPEASKDVHHILIELGAHHLDLHLPHANDPPTVTAARAKEEAIIASWIQAAGAVSAVIV